MCVDIPSSEWAYKAQAKSKKYKCYFYSDSTTDGKHRMRDYIIKTSQKSKSMSQIKSLVLSKQTVKAKIFEKLKNFYSNWSSHTWKILWRFPACVTPKSLVETKFEVFDDGS